MEFPDIEALAKRIGAPPCSYGSDGTPNYTVPIISDPNTGKVVSDSFLIAEYLDATYPGEKVLFPPGTKPLVAAFEAGVVNAMSGLFPVQLTATCGILNPSSEAYFRRTREPMFGRKVEEFSSEGPQRDADVAKGKAAFDAVDGWLAKSEGKFVLGDSISYADAVLGGWFVWIKVTNLIWGDVATWHNGRWATHLENVERAGYASAML